MWVTLQLCWPGLAGFFFQPHLDFDGVLFLITTLPAGIVCGHAYYFAADVYPICSSVRGGGRSRIVRTPAFFVWVTGLPGGG